MADRLTSLVPAPKAVTLAGRAFPVWEATVADLAELQAWVDSQHPDPFEGVEERAAAAVEGPVRDLVWLEALDAAGEGRPAYDGTGGRELLATPEGVVAVLLIALRRGTPDAAAAVPGLLGEGGMAPGEFGALWRAFFGQDPAARARAALGMQSGSGRRGRTLTWGEAAAGLCRDYGWPPAVVYGLTLTEFALYRRGGKPAPAGFTGTPAELKAWARRIHLARHGTEPPDPDAGPVPSGGTFHWVRANGG